MQNQSQSGVKQREEDKKVKGQHVKGPAAGQIQQAAEQIQEDGRFDAKAAIRDS